MPPMTPDHAPIKLDPVQVARLRARFPAVADLAARPDRRQFLRVMAASLSLAGLAGCDDDDPRDEEVPPVHQSAHAAPAQNLTYASAALIDGFANGVMVTTSNGRPIKIEGNAKHPWSRGGTDVFAQASVLSLYDPYRSQSVLQYGKENSWAAFSDATAGMLAALRAQGGEGLRLLTGPFTSPTQAAQVAALRATFPKSHWHSHAAIGRSPLYESAQRVFGRPLETRWDFSRATTIVALDGDFLDAGPHQVGAAKSWSAARRQAAARGVLPRTFSAAAVPSLTAARADFSVAANPDELKVLAECLLAAAEGQTTPALPPHLGEWTKAASSALMQARGSSLVQAGLFASPAVLDAVHRINAALGNVGETVIYTAPVAPQGESLESLVAAMKAGEVQMLYLLDTNPVYDAPPALGFAQALQKVPTKIHAGLYADETALACDWHLPLAHPLESWGDARSLDGSATLIQPTIAPLYGGRTVPEILSMIGDPVPQGAFALVRAYWKSVVPAGEFDAQWHQAFLDGVWPGTHFQAESVQTQGAGSAGVPALGMDDALHVVFRPDPTIWDGAFANNAWLQELPKPLTKLTWENAILISPAMASREKISQGDVVRVSAGKDFVEAAAFVAPGQADRTISITLGYGRQMPDQLANGLGVGAVALRDTISSWGREGAKIALTGASRVLATTYGHTPLDGHANGKPLVQVLQPGVKAAGSPAHAVAAKDGDGRAWGMVIDLDGCIGCNACVTACQAENNIAVVGREEVLAGREMHWLRIEAETPQGDASQEAHFMPVPCMQCEDAPCEIGCPVEATLHDHEGLNLMVYNRCIGTRACSGYCPYKVRRFNYHDYSAGAAPSLQLQRNPNVTVRAEGVMEKCTFCVQRIAQARIAADLGDGVIPDGAVRTACQAACPTDAISFGNLIDNQAGVTRARSNARNYALLGELNTRPRTTYLARLAQEAAG